MHLRFGAMILLACLGLAPVSLRADDAAAKPAAEAGPNHGSTEHGQHDHIGHANAGPNLEKPEEFKSDLALFTLVVFLLLLGVLWKFAWGPISQALDKREHTVAEHLAAAERTQQEARQLLADYEQKLAGAAGQVSEMLAEARRDADATRQQIVAEAQSAAAAERARALHEIDTATGAALQQLAERSASLAVDLAGKFVRAKITPEEHARLVQDAVGRFPQQVSSN